MINNMNERDQEVLKLLYDLGRDGPYRSLPSYTHIQEFSLTYPKKKDQPFVADGLPKQIGRRVRDRT